jgi:succinyl-CoA synthetase beta subunit
LTPICILKYAIRDMRLYEFEGTELFRNEDIMGPQYAVVSSPAEAKEKAQEIGLPVVIKAQVLTGGRYLAGGVRTARTLEEVETITQHIMAKTISGMPVPYVMIASEVPAEVEFYVGIAIDAYQGTPVAILSTGGGVSVNVIARDHPEWVSSRHVPISTGLSLSEAKQMAHDVGLSGRDLIHVAETLTKIYKVFRSKDALVAEINPLVRTPEGKYLALDAKVEIDDSGLYRHPELNIDMSRHIFSPIEQKAREIGISYVEMDGDIALIASGAGLGMTSIDIISQKFRPANFLETGGAITAELLYNIMDLVLMKEGIRAVFINVYGGINPIHEGARGVVRYIREHNVTIPVVAKALGNHQEETWEILRQQGVVVVTDSSTEKAVEELARVLEKTA